MNYYLGHPAGHCLENMLHVSPLTASEGVCWCFWRHSFLLKHMREDQKKVFLLPIWTSPHPGRREHFHTPLWFFFFFILLNSRLFCSCKGPIYSSAQVEREFPPSEPFFASVTVFFFLSWKKDKSQLVSLIMATPQSWVSFTNTWGLKKCCGWSGSVLSKDG